MSHRTRAALALAGALALAPLGLLAPAQAADPATQRILLTPYDAAGHLKDGWSITHTFEDAADCSENLSSPYALAPGTHLCGGAPDACWAEPGTDDSLVCLVAPQELWRYPATGIGETGGRGAEALPAEVTLTDGSVWTAQVLDQHTLRNGERAVYRCDAGCATSHPDSIGYILMPDSGIIFDKSAPIWTVLTGWTEVRSAIVHTTETMKVRSVAYLGAVQDAALDPTEQPTTKAPVTKAPSSQAPTTGPSRGVPARTGAE